MSPITSEPGGIVGAIEEAETENLRGLHAVTANAVSAAVTKLRAAVISFIEFRSHRRRA